MSEPTSAPPGAYDPTELVSQDDPVGLLDILQVVAENLRALVVAPIVVGVLALAGTFLLTPTFTATTRFLPPQQQPSGAAAMLQSLGSLGGLAGASSALKNPGDQYVSFLRSRHVQDELVGRFKLRERYQQDLQLGARRALEGKSRISIGKDNIITVEFEDRDPQFAAQVANGYVDALRALLGQLAVTEAQQRRMFFEAQLKSAKTNLVAAEQALARSGVGPAAVNALPSAAIEAPARLRAQITAQEVQLASLRSYLTDSAPEVRQTRSELAALRAQLSTSEREQTRGAGGDDYITKLREFKYQETLFELFARQYEIARVDESREGAVVQVVDVAVPPERKSKPRRLLTVAGAAAIALVAVLAWALARHLLARAEANPESAAKLNAMRSAWRRALGRRPAAR